MKVINLTALLFLWFIYKADTLQVYSEDNKLTTFQCPPYNNSVSFLDVYLVMENVPIIVYSCLSKECKNVLGDLANLTNSGSSFPITLSVNEKRTMTRIICAFSFIPTSVKWNYSEDVTFFAKAQDVQCFDTQLSNNNTQISVTCMTLKIFPKAHCYFNVSNQVLGQVSYSHVSYTNNVEYYQSNCTWSASLINFKKGIYALDVSVYPNVTNDSNFASNLKVQFQLTVPNVLLSNECFNGFNIVDGYIKPESVAVCECYLDSTGYPPAFLKWSNSSHLDLGRPKNSTSTSLVIEPSTNIMKYYCTLFTNLLNENSSILYTVNYAKGPSNCSIEMRDTTETVWKLCKNTFINWTIFCQVNQSDAIPGIKAKITSNSVYSPLLDSQIVTNMYQVKHEMNITEAANYSIGCQAQNMKFSDVTARCSYPVVLQVMAPPKSSPLLKITSNIIDIKDKVQENEVYTVVCTASGGIPPVSSIKVSCGNITEATQSGNIFTSPVTFTRNMTGQNCTCTAEHITGCYENYRSILQTNVFYKSAVTLFNVNTITTENGTIAQFLCKANGNPAPNISFSKGSATIAQNVSGYYLFLNKSMSCKDAGYYLCHAKNGIDFNDESTHVTVNVKCPLQFTTDTNVHNFSLKQGMLFSYNFSIYGYPEPDKFTIFKSNKILNNLVVSNTSIEPPYVLVNLQILNMTSSDFDNYTLYIYQNGTIRLRKDFIINEAKESILLSSYDSNFAAPIGGSIGAFLVFFLIVSGIVIARKYEWFAKKEKKNENRHAYFDMPENVNEQHPYADFSNNLSEAREYDSTTTFIEKSTYESLKGNESSKHPSVPQYNNVNILPDLTPYCNTVRIEEMNNQHSYTNETISSSPEKRPYNNVDIANVNKQYDN